MRGKGSIYSFVKRCAMEGISLAEGCRRYRKEYRQNHVIITRWFRSRWNRDPRVVKIGKRWGYRWGNRIVMWNEVREAETASGGKHHDGTCKDTGY